MLRASEAGLFAVSRRLLALRIPLLQWATISTDASSSFEALGEFSERNQLRSGDAADLVFVRLAHIDQNELVAAIDFRLHFNRVDVAFRCQPVAVYRKTAGNR